MTDPLAPLIVLPSVARALTDVDRAISSVSLSARRHAGRIATRALSAAAIATCELENLTDAAVGISLIDEVPALPDVRSAPLQAMARLHAIAGVNELSSDRGRPRSDFVETDRLHALVEVGASSSPAVVVAAILHGEILTLAPFSTANGLVARAMFRAALTQRGIDPLISAEIGFRDLGLNALTHALRSYLTGTAEGVSEWITFNTRAVLYGVSALGDLINSE